MKTVSITLVIVALAFAGTIFSKSSFSKSNVDVIEKSFNVASKGTLRLDTDSGSISVESHSSETVDVRVELKGKLRDNMKIGFDHDGADLSVQGDRESSFSWGFNNGNAKFIIKVPRHYDLALKTSGGSIQLSSLTGTVKARTSGGSIKVDQITGDLKVKTSGGSIKVDEVSGAIDAKTSGGSIKLRMTEQPKHDSQLRTSGGSVKAYLASGIAVDLTASTSGGSVSTDFNVNGSVRRTSIAGEINGGGPKLKLHTSGGSVKIEKI